MTFAWRKERCRSCQKPSGLSQLCPKWLRQRVGILLSTVNRPTAQLVQNVIPILPWGPKVFKKRVGSQAVTKVRTMHNLPHLRVPAAEVLVNASGSLKPRNCKPHQAKSNENDPDLPHRLIAEQWPFTTSGRELHHVWEPATVAEQKHQKHLRDNTTYIPHFSIRVGARSK